MNIKEVEELLHEFDQSSLREFAWNNGSDQLSFSKNDGHAAPAAAVANPVAVAAPVAPAASETAAPTEAVASANSSAEGEAVTSPLVGVAYLKPAPDKSEFVKVGDTVKKGQTLLIIEAMKVMNEIPAPADGVVTEIMVSPEDVVEYGQELVRIK
ncbi:acetyl-CoA carboxylase biotin carboxyl carrier protein [Lactococcus termiticola]|uniref:Biotin carboxyl carrier protein of acetyl-CoA carboxylase n=1 Tax=Lactococcus termiticola TaxID=2169526 RepID=A0A2R5HED1_9LACT|nr:acetyl-CoA carboxylase biotin carboxyl carrier protein [Lactococcus termiticola]GBG96176.1 acetyl-CoA carboxylase, biotin carboxyl carrier protein [Lactococcus termiticola]